MNNMAKPLPVVDNDSSVFWENCKQERLVLQECQDCSKFYFYPRILCPHCMSSNVEWKEVSGSGKIYSFTIARRPAGPAFKEDLPYAVGLIELDEGPRMMSNIINIPVDDIRCDMPVKVKFEAVNEQFTLPKFEPISNEE